VRSISKPVAFLLTLGVSLSVFPQAKPVNRITQAIDERETVVLPDTADPRLQAAVDQGRMDGAFQLQASIVFKRTATQDAAIEKLLAEQQDPTSPNYHKWLTPEQYADQFGLSPSDIAAVTAWLQAQGFTVNRVARGRSQIWFTGPIARIETVFRTEMHHYQVNGESHFANGTPLAVPAALSEMVLGLRNLDDFRPRARVRPRHIPDPSVKSDFTSSISGFHFLIPADFATIYDVNYSSADGTGVKLVVVGQTALFSTGTGGVSPPASPTDIDAFRAAASLPPRTATNFVQTLVPGTGTAALSTMDIDESNIDLEWAAGIAKNVNEIFVYVGNSTNFSVFDAFQFAIDQNLAPVISISYGNCESALGAASLQTIQGWTQQANAQGQTISAAAGDSGAADCEASTATQGTHGLAVDVPGALPYVTSVGGTEFTGDAAGTVSGSCANATPYWAQSCSLTSGGSALSYIPETSWNDTTSAGHLDATGGGASIVFSKPSWQTGTGVPADGARDVPDVALNASNAHDPYLFCSQGSCVNGFRNPNSNPANGLTAAGGTSFGAPAFAGIVAMLNQKTGSRQGNVNPTLYALAASTPSVFHDITTGNNIVPCGAGTPNCPTTAPLQYGHSAGVGYDLVTGWGTIDVNNLLTNWSSGNPTTADFTIFGAIGGTFISAPGGSASSTITIDSRNGFSGAVTLTCSPPASALITCSVTGSPVTPSGTPSTGTATLTINTTKAGTSSPATSARLGHHGAPFAPLWLSCSGALLVGAFLLGIPTRHRRWSIVLTLVAVALLAAAVGCGGSSSSGGGGSAGTPAGNYTVTVTGTSGSTTHTTSVLVTVL
jgi:subtilase family serine protease